MVKINLSNLRGDFTGGLTAGIVALPLALALGVASGLGPMAGLYGAIAVGFFAALFGGTPAQISGPTGPMVVVLAGLFASLSGDASLIFTAVILAGIFQIVFGVLGVGQYIRLVPYPVISGFMSGIGAIIIILQIGRLLGHEPPGGTIGALTYLPTALADIDFATDIVAANVDAATNIVAANVDAAADILLHQIVLICPLRFLLDYTVYFVENFDDLSDANIDAEVYIVLYKILPT